MRIAVPVENGVLCSHFGNCQQFSFIDVNPDTRQITEISFKTPPPHQPGILPAWISEQGCNLVIAGGIGMRANNMFHQSGISVISGAPSKKPEELVSAFLEGTLESGGNLCNGPEFKKQGGHNCHGDGDH